MMEPGERLARRGDQRVCDGRYCPDRCHDVADWWLPERLRLRPHSEPTCSLGTRRDEQTADSEPFRTPVPIESVHRFRRFRTPVEETLLAAGGREALLGRVPGKPRQAGTVHRTP